MSKDRDRHKTEYDLDQLLKESFRMDDKTLLERFQRAQIEIDDSQIPPEPEDGFERLLEKIEPRYTRDSTPEKKFRKIRRLKPIFKVAMVAGVVVMILLATTITAGAKKYFTYRKTARASIRNAVILDNDKNKEEKGRLGDAYEEIQKDLGIDAMRLDYIPQGMIYSETVISNETATMIFEYGNKTFSVLQQIRDAGDSMSVISDRKVEKEEKVYNKWLNVDLEIQKSIIDNEDIEFSTEIILNNTYYYLSAVMEKEEFVKIIQSLYIER